MIIHDPIPGIVHRMQSFLSGTDTFSFTISFGENRRLKFSLFFGDAEDNVRIRVHDNLQLRQDHRARRRRGGRLILYHDLSGDDETKIGYSVRLPSRYDPSIFQYIVLLFMRMHQEFGIETDVLHGDVTGSIVSTLRRARYMLSQTHDQWPKWVRLGSNFIHHLKHPLGIHMEPILPPPFNPSFRRVAYTMWVLLSSSQSFHMRVQFGPKKKNIFQLLIEYNEEDEEDDDPKFQIDPDIPSINLSSLHLHRVGQVIRPGTIDDWDGLLRLEYDAGDDSTLEYETIVPFMNLFRVQQAQRHQYHEYMCQSFMRILAEMYRQFGLFTEFPDVTIDGPTQSYIDQQIFGHAHHHPDWAESAFQFIRYTKTLQLRPPRNRPVFPNPSSRRASDRHALRSIFSPGSSK